MAAPHAFGYGGGEPAEYGDLQQAASANAQFGG